MSEYRWRVQKAWIGVMRRVRDERGLFKDDVLLGVIRRSGWVQQVGHFCHVDIQVLGKKYTASGAEARIWPFHSIHLEEGEECPELELKAIGWCRDSNTYAFRTTSNRVVELVGPGKDGETSLREIPKNNWPESIRPAAQVGLWEELRPGVFRRRS